MAGSNVTFHLLAQILILSTSLLRLVVIALGSSVDLILQKRVESSAYFNRVDCRTHRSNHLLRQRIGEGLGIIPVGLKH